MITWMTTVLGSVLAAEDSGRTRESLFLRLQDKLLGWAIFGDSPTCASKTEEVSLWPWRRTESVRHRDAEFLLLGVFLVPYIVFLVTCGIPLFFAETSLGQFSRQSGVTCWNSICLLAKGLCSHLHSAFAIYLFLPLYSETQVFMRNHTKILICYSSKVWAMDSCWSYFTIYVTTSSSWPGLFFTCSLPLTLNFYGAAATTPGTQVHAKPGESKKKNSSYVTN